MLTRLAYRINSTLERYLPEQRLFLKSDVEMRFIRLRATTQAVALVMGSLVLGWTVFATAFLLLESISAGSSRDQTQRQQTLFETRLTDLSQDRDLRVSEAAGAQERFNLALAQVSDMQARLLASEDRRRELETGIDVIQNTLRRTIKERDAARAELDRVQFAVSQSGGETVTELGRIRDTEQTLDILAAALDDTARERDMMVNAAERAADRIEEIAVEKRAIEARNDVIFTQLEEALTVSVEPLEKMFRGAGMSPESMLDAVRRGYSGQGGPLTKISLSTSNGTITRDEQRANALLTELDRMNLYRLAAFKAPFAMPVKGNFRWTSGFGYRRDPKGYGTRMHEGTDMAGDYGTPVYATGDGVVTHSGWDSGYGRLVKIRHDFGIETRYAHLSDLHVSVGQKVSRGDRIGDMGNSGRSTGTHLHYEVRIGGTAVNPMTFIRAAQNVF